MGSGEEGRVKFKASSMFVVVCLLLGCFGVMPSWAERRVFKGGGGAEHACAWRRAPLHGKGKVHFGHI